MEKRSPFLIKELKGLNPGSQIWGKYMILEKVQRKTKDARTLVNLKIGDASGDMDVIVWDNCNISGSLENGAVIGLLGDLGLYNNRLQVTAKRIKVVEEDITPYLKGPASELKELVQGFEEILDSINDPHIKNLLAYIFTPETKTAFIKAPGAKKIHHNYPGGLLEHTLKVAQICSKLSGLYPVLNRDLLVAGALLHDIGKVREYEIVVLPEYTASGRLVGHIVLGSEMVGDCINKIRQQGESFPSHLEMMLKHMILSHHGTLEYGSPVKPLFPEALMLHMADNLDAKLFVYINKIQDEEAGEGLFTAYDTIFQQYFFKYRYNSED